MSNPFEDGADAFLPEPLTPKRGKDKADWKKAIDGAADFLDQGALTEAQLAVRLLRVADSAQVLLAGGLTENALCLLIQAKLPNLSNGSKPSFKLIMSVLNAVAGLGEYVVQPARDAVEKVRGKAARK